MRMRGKISTLALLCLAALPLLAQSTPVQGLQKTTEEISKADGTFISRKVTYQKFFRSSDGTILVQQMRDESSNAPVTAAEMLDYGHTRKVYELDYGRGIAIARHSLRALPSLPSPAQVPPSSVIGEETIQQVHCIIQRSYAVIGGKKIVVGKVWVSPENGFLVMKVDTTTPIPDGTVHHETTELYNVKFAEPDAKLMTLDPKFKVVNLER